MDSRLTGENVRIELLNEFAVFSWYVNVSKAAAELHISQSTLSKHISILEKELGVKLIRNGKQLSMTSAGRYFADYVCSMIPDFKYAVHHIRKLQEHDSDFVLKIEKNHMNSAAFICLKKFTVEFFSGRRYQQVQMVNLSNNGIEKMLLNDELDLAIHVGFKPVKDEIQEFAQKGIELIPFIDDEMFVWAREDNGKLSGKEIINIKDLKELRMMTMVNNRGLLSMYEFNNELLNENTVPFHPDSYYMDDFTDFLQLDPGDSVFLLPKSMESILPSSRILNMAIHEFENQEVMNHTYLAFKAENSNPILPRFIEYCLSQLNQDDSGVFMRVEDQ